MFFYIKSPQKEERYAIIKVSTAGSDFNERKLIIMSENKNAEEFVDMSGLTDLERSILLDFQLLSEEEQKTILESIVSLLGKK